MSDNFRDKDGSLIRIKINPYTNEVTRDENELIDFQVQHGFRNPYIESWAFITREFKSDGGGVRMMCTIKKIFDTENKAINYLHDNGWTKYKKPNEYKRSHITDGWSASEKALITCEKIKLKAW